MVTPVTYMGTKRQLAAHVGKIAEDCRKGAFLDVFAGMCSVGSAIAPTRNIWSNDKQAFAVIVAKARFLSRSSPPSIKRIDDIDWEILARFTSQPERTLAAELELERSAVETSDLSKLVHLYSVGSERLGCLGNGSVSCGTFVDRYAGTYFGFQQCIEIDGIRKLIDELLSYSLINADEHRWLLVALARAISKVSTTTGHFAQPLRPKPNNLNKFSAQRRRAVKKEWIDSIGELHPAGTEKWRSKNKVFQCDSEILIGELRREKIKPSLIYADPPYTKDQYSRFYHVYETLVLNDNPIVSGAGIYRDDRFTSQFSLASHVEDSIETLIAQCAEIGADLILSYPTNGLLADSNHRIPEMFQQHYRKVPQSLALDHVHSTMGGSKGIPRSSVTEMLYWVNA